ncbi:hypothetical protein QFZ96_008451 [Paraburkholderia youngii]
MPPTSAAICLPLICEPMMFVSPPDITVTLFAPFTCEALRIDASLFASPCAFDIAAETPKPPPSVYCTPTLALLELFELRVESVSVVLMTFTWFFAARMTSFALTFDPAIVRLPFVATNPAVPPACTLEPRCIV